jgi:6-phospho-3-hexuloisomerase
LLAVISGAGETATSLHYLRVAREKGAQTLLITASPDSSCGRTADLLVCLPASARRRPGRRARSVQSLSLFEQACFVVLEAMAAALLRRRGITGEKLLERHANLE